MLTHKIYLTDLNHGVKRYEKKNILHVIASVEEFGNDGKKRNKKIGIGHGGYWVVTKNDRVVLRCKRIFTSKKTQELFMLRALDKYNSI